MPEQRRAHFGATIFRRKIVFPHPASTTVLQNPTGLQPLSTKGLFSRRFQFIERNSPVVSCREIRCKIKGFAFCNTVVLGRCEGIATGDADMVHCPVRGRERPRPRLVACWNVAGLACVEGSDCDRGSRPTLRDLNGQYNVAENSYCHGRGFGHSVASAENRGIAGGRSQRKGAARAQDWMIQPENLS
jgi:hypothetical protein